MERIILASASPRRRQLLEQAGIPFETVVSNAREIITKTEPGQIVEELSCCKAQAVRQALGAKTPEEGASGGKADAETDRLILGADTIVVLDGKILGKPGNADGARRMLAALQGRTHQVYTGVTLIRKETVHSFHERTEVSLYPMDEQEIEDYIQSGDCMDKAGAYGIQGRFAVHIKGINGDYNNVVGLPLGRLWQELKQRRLWLP